MQVPQKGFLKELETTSECERQRQRLLGKKARSELLRVKIERTKDIPTIVVPIVVVYPQIVSSRVKLKRAKQKLS
jgi:hypothetical protein